MNNSKIILRDGDDKPELLTDRSCEVQVRRPTWVSTVHVYSFPDLLISLLYMADWKTYMFTHIITLDGWRNNIFSCWLGHLNIGSRWLRMFFPELLSCDCVRQLSREHFIPVLILDKFWVFMMHFIHNQIRHLKHHQVCLFTTCLPASSVKSKKVYL